MINWYEVQNNMTRKERLMQKKTYKKLLNKIKKKQKELGLIWSIDEVIIECRIENINKLNKSKRKEKLLRRQ